MSNLIVEYACSFCGLNQKEEFLEEVRRGMAWQGPAGCKHIFPLEQVLSVKSTKTCEEMVEEIKAYLDVASSDVEAGQLTNPRIIMENIKSKICNIRVIIKCNHCKDMFRKNFQNIDLHQTTVCPKCKKTVNVLENFVTISSRG